MNPTSFDRVAMRLARRTTRRRTVRAIAASASVLFLGSASSARAQSGLFAGIELGGTCTETPACAQVQACNVPGQVLCADNGMVEDGLLTCCLGEGGYCVDATHCCAGMACVGHSDDACGAGTCQFNAWVSTNPGCDAYLASVLAQLPPSTAYSILSTWGQSTPALVALPAHCGWPALPPESPWCTPDFCTDRIPLEHSDDGLEYCYWYDPDLAGLAEDPSERAGRRAKWRCRSLDLIASTP